jgi:hypothetical protein
LSFLCFLLIGGIRFTLSLFPPHRKFHFSLYFLAICKQGGHSLRGPCGTWCTPGSHGINSLFFCDPNLIPLCPCSPLPMGEPPLDQCGDSVVGKNHPVGRLQAPGLCLAWPCAILQAPDHLSSGFPSSTREAGPWSLAPPQSALRI